MPEAHWLGQVFVIPLVVRAQAPRFPYAGRRVCVGGGEHAHPYRREKGRAAQPLYMPAGRIRLLLFLALAHAPVARVFVKTVLGSCERFGTFFFLFHFCYLSLVASSSLFYVLFFGFSPQRLENVGRPDGLRGQFRRERATRSQRLSGCCVIELGPPFAIRLPARPHNV